ncbi:unnamed protein product, partial [Mesorhabditis spiculigera]
MLFPVNVCTREMVRNGECPMEKLSSDPYDFIKLEYSTAYFMQCDDSWILPSTAGESGCIPSLHVAGGLAPDDPEVFRGEVKDLDYNRIKDKFCRVGVPANGDCVLPPLSGFKLPKRLEDAGFKEAMVTPCSYKQRGEKIEKDCVLLDLMMDGKVVIADRNGHGPYATLQSRNDSLTMTWKVDNNYPYSFPRCIDLSNQVGLPENHFDTALSDSFLNCAKNPYYARAKEGQITIDSVEPFNCNTDKELRRLLCRTTNQTLTSAAEASTKAARSRILDYVSWFEWWTCGCFFLGAFVAPLLGFAYIAFRSRSIPVPVVETQPKWKIPSKESLAAIDKFVKNACKTKDLLDDCLPPGMPDEAECQVFMEHKDENRCQTTRLLDKSRYKIEGDDKFYINASKFSMKGCKAKWVMTQAPLPGTREAFWIMIEDLLKNAIVSIICMNSFEPVLEGDTWFPDLRKAHATPVGDGECRLCRFGKMSPTAVKVERAPTLRNIQIANLRSEGYPTTGWEELFNVLLVHKAPLTRDADIRAEQVEGRDRYEGHHLRNIIFCRAILQTVQFAYWENIDYYVLQSANGTGTAAIFVMVYVIIERLRNGMETTVAEVLEELRTHVPAAIATAEQYLAVYACVLMYTQAHLKTRYGKELQSAIGFQWEHRFGQHRLRSRVDDAAPVAELCLRLL